MMALVRRTEGPVHVDKMTVPRIRGMRRSGKRIVMITAYDATFARLVDLAGVDIVLVGDSLGNVIQGHETTLPVTLEDVIYHTRAVSRGLQRPLLIADMPFMTYQVSADEAVRNAGRLIQEGRAEGVKLEGGRRVTDIVLRLVQAGIPVMGHLGLTPQSFHEFGGYKIQGREQEAANALLEDALALEAAGAFSMVLEGVPIPLAERISQAVNIPTIGIGAGPHCGGQVLVIHDLLGLDERFKPRFVKRYAELSSVVQQAVAQFGTEVRAGSFPGNEHGFE